MSAGDSCCASSDKLAAGATLDPVCGMTVDPATAKHVSTHAGQPVYFCSARCQAKFDAALATFPVAGQQPEAEGCCGDQPAAHQQAHHEHTHHAQAQAVKDPVCGMTVDPQTAKYHAEHAGQTYHFCSVRCRERAIICYYRSC